MSNNIKTKRVNPRGGGDYYVLRDGVKIGRVDRRYGRYDDHSFFGMYIDGIFWVAFNASGDMLAAEFKTRKRAVDAVVAAGRIG